MEVHTCRFASVMLPAAAAAADFRSCTMCSSQVHLCHLCPFDKGKTFTVITVVFCESDPVLVIGTFSVFCMIAHFPLGGCCLL